MELGLSIAFFMFTFAVGHQAKAFQYRVVEPKIPIDTVSKIVALLVTLGWLASVIKSILDSTYETPLPLYAIMGLLAGYLWKTNPGARK